MTWSDLWQDEENAKDYHVLTTAVVILHDNFSVTCDYGPYSDFWDIVAVEVNARGMHIIPAPGSHFDQNNECFSKDPNECAFIITTNF